MSARKRLPTSGSPEGTGVARRKPVAKGKSANGLPAFLENLFVRYHRPEFLGSDPLSVVREFRDPADREVAALFAALLAYGAVRQINASLRALFGAMDSRPAQFVASARSPGAAAVLAGWRHRFTGPREALALARMVGGVIACGGLEEAFVAGLRDDEPDLAPAATRFTERLRAASDKSDRAVIDGRAFRHLLPRPEGGSAAKRICLFLRWMVRPDDGIDLGLWPRVPAAKLIMPVDTHVLRIGGHLGLITRKSASLAAAREITAALRRIDPADPTRFDFALSRLGILRDCPTRPREDSCRRCELTGVCRRSEGRG